MAGKVVDFNYGSIDVGYYDQVFRKANGVQRKWHHTKFERIRGLITLGQDHLDTGCGLGTFIGTLDESVRSAGVDLAYHQIAYATQQYGSVNRRFEVVERGCLPFEDDSFDVVTCIEVLEHLSEEEGTALVAEARRVLKPGARLVVTTQTMLAFGQRSSSASIGSARSLIRTNTSRTIPDQNFCHFSSDWNSTKCAAQSFS